MKKLQSRHTFIMVLSIFFLLFSGSVHAQFVDSWALFVVADADNPNAAENEIVIRLEDMDFEVEVVGQNDANDGSTDDMSIVLISATVTSSTIATNMPGLRDLEIPIINWEPALDDSLGYSATDGGEFGTTEIDIVLADHPLAAGLPEGPVAITNASKQVSYGTPAGDVQIIAVNPNDDSQAVLFAYEKGAAMFLGEAPARRVSTFLLNDVADNMTAEGWDLFDASVKWAMNLQDSTTSVDHSETGIPTQFILHNNYPNPFNPTTHIAFSIPTQAHVRLSVWNALGEKAATLVDEIRPAGNHTVTFDAADFSSGLYFCRMNAGSYSATNKMLYLK